jgi:hypothetical protein
VSEAPRWLLVDQACYESERHRIRHESDDQPLPQPSWVAYRKIPGNSFGYWLGHCQTLVEAQALCAADNGALELADKKNRTAA